jgi:hypothetical protein
MNDRLFLKIISAGYLLSLLFWAFRFTGHFPAMMDTLEYVFPEKWVNVESFQAGQIALWNPWIFNQRFFIPCFGFGIGPDCPTGFSGSPCFKDCWRP